MNLVNSLKDEDVDDARLHVNILNPGWEFWHPTAAGLKSTLCSCWVKRSNSTDVKIKMLSAGESSQTKSYVLMFLLESDQR